MESHKIPWFQTISQIGSNWDVHRRVDHKRGVPSNPCSLPSFPWKRSQSAAIWQVRPFDLRCGVETGRGNICLMGLDRWHFHGQQAALPSMAGYLVTPCYTLLLTNTPIPVCFITLYCSHLCWLTPQFCPFVLKATSINQPIQKYQSQLCQL